MSSSGYTTRVYCNRCKGETNHLCKGEHQYDYTELSGLGGEPTGWWEKQIFRLLICAGCEAATLEENYTNAGSYDHQRDDYCYSTSYEPQRNQRSISPKKFRQLPKNLVVIYNESVQALNAKLHVLCAAGLRALIEGICTDKGITKGNLESRIDKLIEYLPENLVTNIHSFRFMGNEAIHRLRAPGENELRLAIEVCEDLLNFMYDLDYKASQLPTKMNGHQGAI